MRDFHRSNRYIALLCFSSLVFFVLVPLWLFLEPIVAPFMLLPAVTGFIAAVWSALNPPATVEESTLILRLALARPRQEIPWASVQGWTKTGSGAGTLVLWTHGDKKVKVQLSQFRSNERSEFMSEFQRHVGPASPA